MSWSIDAVVKTGPNVAEKVQDLFDKVSLNNPTEKLIKDRIAETCVILVKANSPGQFLKIEASGSAYTASPAEYQNAKLSVQPIYGMVIE